MRRRRFLLAAGLAGTSLAWTSSAAALDGEADSAALLANQLGDVSLTLPTLIAAAEAAAADHPDPVTHQVRTGPGSRCICSSGVIGSNAVSKSVRWHRRS